MLSASTMFHSDHPHLDARLEVEALRVSDDESPRPRVDVALGNGLEPTGLGRFVVVSADHDYFTPDIRPPQMRRSLHALNDKALKGSPNYKDRSLGA